LPIISAEPLGPRSDLSTLRWLCPFALLISSAGNRLLRRCDRWRHLGLQNRADSRRALNPCRQISHVKFFVSLPLCPLSATLIISAFFVNRPLALVHGPRLANARWLNYVCVLESISPERFRRNALSGPASEKVGHRLAYAIWQARTCSVVDDRPRLWP
jgi:hypothetical protein